MIIETYNLSKTYGNHNVLDKINIHVKEGEIYGFVGKNGAGKTTLMKMLCGLITPTSGTFKLLGYDDVNEARKHIGSLIESPAVYPNLTAKENLIYYSKLRGIKRDVEELLTKVGLENAIDKKAGAFSLGMKQRLSIAIALLNDPELLILDEPINGLDPAGIVEIRKLLIGLKDEGKTIFISSHIMSELARLATSYGIVSNGHLVEEFTAEELLSKTSECAHIKTDNDPLAIQLLKDHFHIERIERQSEDEFMFFDHLDEIAKINRYLNEQGLLVSKVGVYGEDSEDYFLSKMEEGE